jgi:hypothetical protein
MCEPLAYNDYSNIRCCFWDDSFERIKKLSDQKRKEPAMAFEIKRAEKKKSRLRIGVSGTSGSGKTYSALRLADGLVGSLTKVCVIDSESGSANLYEHLGPYSVILLEAPFSPERYIDALHTAEQAGFECIVIDSASHEWEGKGGVLEINETIAQTKFKGNTWSAWSVTTPRHQKFIEAILTSPAHIITTARSKQDTIQVDGKVKKVGTKEIQREGFEYELTVNFNIDRDNHLATASKDRTGIFINADPFIITEDTGKTLREWAERGVEPISTSQPATEEQKDRLRYFMDKGLLDKAFADRLGQATFLKTAELIKRLEIQEQAQEIEAKEAAPKTAPKGKSKAEPVTKGATA